jgi:hypothetical protein
MTFWWRLRESRMKSWDRKKAKWRGNSRAKGENSTLVRRGNGFRDRFKRRGGFGGFLGRADAGQELGGLLQVNKRDPIVHPLLQNHRRSGNHAVIVQGFQFGSANRAVRLFSDGVIPLHSGPIYHINSMRANGRNGRPCGTIGCIGRLKSTGKWPVTRP